VNTASWLRIAVQDEGPGLTDADKTKIFEKFTRLSAQPTAGESSTGLGLAISKELMKQMQGEIGYESEVGKGATFFIRLPLVRLLEGQEA
jgi:signal transduction histidine kinase